MPEDMCHSPVSGLKTLSILKKFPGKIPQAFSRITR
jgi:hypothetical protein